MPHCTKCGTEVLANAAVCPKCGQPQATTSGGAGVTSGAQSGMNENLAGPLCYLGGWVTGIIFFLIDKRPFVRFHAAQSIVIFGGIHVVLIGLGIIWGGGWLFGGWSGWSGFGLGFVAHSLIRLFAFVLWIVLMVKASQGERFKVPVAADLAESFSK